MEKKTIMIDYGNKTSSGMHEFLELASKRDCVFPAFNIRNTKVIAFCNKLMKLGMPKFYHIILSDWKNKLSNVGTVVITANYLTVGIVKYLNKYYPNINVHIFYFNIIEKDVPIDRFYGLNCTLWSFDKDDVEKYNMNYSPTPTCFENFISKDTKYSSTKYDVFFLGVDKGRLSRLLDIRKNFVENKVSVEYHIVDVFGEGNNNNFEYSSFISYHQYLEKAKNAKALLEIKQENQNGNTLRPVEAGFMKKKLITDDESIKKEPFYRKENTYILGESRDIYKFINTIPYDDSFDYNQYDIEKWLKQFN
ncbi:hypothetical protein JZO77_21655 [Enterococcus hulanensis]|uniref:hypothetical protein n=1 Tax=Enterococcus hulanensis TaxID=2559929 RepID=UPI001A901D19|nr:hypothetical protein [Enterococcus hulanensis]MBO0459346.1 hypothetical protein [Enterococcus hulanensis]